LKAHCEQKAGIKEQFTYLDTYQRGFSSILTTTFNMVALFSIPSELTAVYTTLSNQRER